MNTKLICLAGLLTVLEASGWCAASDVSQKNANSTALVVGPVALNGTSYASAATITGNALGSGVNGPQTAQTGLTVNINKDNWWTGGKTGEVDGINVMLRQNAPGSDGSGILVNVQNEGNGFLSATEFASTIVDPVSNTITFGIDVQEGVLDKKTKDFIGAVYTADKGALGSGILIQNSPAASWAYALQYQRNGAVKFSVDGAGAIVGSNATLEGSLDVGNLSNKQAAPYINLNGFGKSGDVRLINDASGQFTVNAGAAAALRVTANGIHTSGSFHLNLATPAKSSSPCSAGQIGADHNYVYICVAPNTWRRSALSSF